jgi:protein-S-isoprenylcysteine O-methyltransferase Ste14
MKAQFITLAVLWVGWCSLHSLLITPAVTGRIQNRWGRYLVYYRLGYNLFSLLTLIPLWAYTKSLSRITGALWSWPYSLVQVLMALLGLAAFVAGGRAYDLPFFLGLRQIMDSRATSLLSAPGSLKSSGILGMVRHPWYTGGLLLIWAQKMDRPILIMSLILSVYFIVGALLEERKLTRIYGQDYRDYQQEVSMFFPLKWLKKKFDDRSSP